MSYKKGSLVEDKSYAFALRIIKLYKFLIADCEYVLSKQVLRSGTSIGAMVKEAEHAQSKADFIHKMSIALKEKQINQNKLPTAFDLRFQFSIFNFQL